MPVDLPVNIHLTGCHHSCAQHYVGDIGLLAAKVDRGEESFEGYHVYIGGGAASTAEQAMAREYQRDIVFEDLARLDREAVGGLARPSRLADGDILPVLPDATRSRHSRSSRAVRRSGRWRHERPDADTVPDPGERPVLDGATGLAERLLRRLPRRRWRQCKRARRGCRRFRSQRGVPLARRLARHGRAAGACEGPQAAAPVDGGDGPARLRAVRLPLPDLRRSGVDRCGSRHGPLRAGRQGNPTQAQGADGRARAAARRLGGRGTGGEDDGRARHA